MRKILNKLHWAVLSVLGLSFWFFLGFPFGHHNESYCWIIELNESGFLQILTQKLEPVATYRPLGQITSWLLYTCSNNSIYPVELFSFFIAIISWMLLALHIKEKGTFSIVTLIIGGFFFSGYIYLFHLHGVFYSPLLLLISLLIITHNNEVRYKTTLSIFSIAILTALFHPFALLIYVFFIIGLIIRDRKELKLYKLILFILLIIISIILINLLTPAGNISIARDNFSGLVTSFGMIEVNIFVSIIAIFLTILTILSFKIRLKHRILLIITIFPLALLLKIIGFPIIFIWISFCFIKCILMSRWEIVFLLLATSSLPLFTGTGSPTYCIFSIMVCSYITSIGFTELETKLKFIDKKVVMVLTMVILIIICCIKLNLNLPVITRLAKPILIEREKTIQLEKIIDRMIASKYKNYKLILKEGAINPADSPEKSLNRKHRAPTYQRYLNEYLAYLREKRNINLSKNEIIVSFGNNKNKKQKAIFKVKGKYAGDAIVFESNNN